MMRYYDNIILYDDYTCSDSVLGAVFATLQFFYNHSEVSICILLFFAIALKLVLYLRY